jgi:ketosteroid isomerase-like protein
MGALPGANPSHREDRLAYRGAMHDNAALLHRFYEAFSRKDAETMARCYADDVVFHDEAFEGLRGERARGMWRMLCGRGRDLVLSYEGVEADESRGKARWTAHYTFTKTGRKVVNHVEASFRFRDGAIVEHTDRFDFHRWARQALGPVGLLAGWTPWLKRKVQAEASRSLDAYLAGR